MSRPCIELSFVHDRGYALHPPIRQELARDGSAADNVAIKAVLTYTFICPVVRHHQCDDKQDKKAEEGESERRNEMARRKEEAGRGIKTRNWGKSEAGER